MELFCAHGYHATGVDMIMQASGVSKKTMYTYFRTKEELVLAALMAYDSVFRNQFMRAVEAATTTPQDKLLAVFDVAHDWFGQNNFYGCPFINAVGEYADTDNPVRQISKLFKQQMHDYVRSLCVAAGAGNPDGLADELALLLEGAIVTAQVSGRPGAAETAKRIAAHRIAEQTKK